MAFKGWKLCHNAIEIVYEDTSMYQLLLTCILFELYLNDPGFGQGIIWAEVWHCWFFSNSKGKGGD